MLNQKPKADDRRPMVTAKLCILDVDLNKLNALKFDSKTMPSLNSSKPSARNRTVALIRSTAMRRT